MARRSQPSRLLWPITAEQLQRIDEMFQELYDDTDNGSLEFDANQLTAGAIPVEHGGTGIDEYVTGDLLYASDTDELSTLAGVAAGAYLRSGGVSTAPVWSSVTLPNSATIGDIIYASAANSYANLAAVAAGSVLRAAGVSTAPAWSTFTIPNTFAQGDLVYANATNVLVALAKNASATRYLSNTGTSNDPAWAQVNLANGVTGDLPFANLTQGSALSVLGVTGNATADVASIAAGTDHQVLRRSGTALAFGAVNLAQAAAVTGVLPVANGGTGVDNTTQTYTPTLTNVTNLDASTAYACQYLRVGNVVLVSGKVDLDPTAAGATELGLSLPIASNLATEQQLGGSAQTAAVAGEGIAIRADAANNRAALVYTAVDVANKSWFFSFAYQVL